MHFRARSTCDADDNDLHSISLLRTALTLFTMLFVGCASTTPDPPQLDRAQLEDPQKCATCHPNQFREWSGSMHAYAGDDPIFRAMNARFVREGGSSDVCVRCHAPVALQDGATKDGTNLALVAQAQRGVTCFFCHTTSAVTGDHDAQLTSGKDLALRGPIASPVGGSGHGSVYASLFDLEKTESAGFCGGCHDVQNGHGVDIERTFAEWRSSVYAKDDAKVRVTCSGCHMPGRVDRAAAVDGAPQRRIHDHSMAAVDVATTPFPDAEAQRRAVQTNLDASIVAKLCVDPPQGPPNVTVTLDNAFVGHGFPSGAAHDRRVWVEVLAYAGGAEVFRSGVVGDGQSVTSLADPNLWLLREQLFDDAKAPVSFMWDARSQSTQQLPPAVTADQTDPAYYHAVAKTYDVPPAADRVTVRVRVVAIGLDVLDELVKSGDLDPAIRAKMPTFTLTGSVLEWKKADGGYRCVP